MSSLSKDQFFEVMLAFSKQHFIVHSDFLPLGPENDRKRGGGDFRYQNFELSHRVER
jgi:hypothetical protein